MLDLLVVGGGINGIGIARDAAGRGLKVAVVEQRDLASATSSSSTKLIHGGLRYLEYYEFRLVREALSEREVLLESAPHIIWPLRFVLPHEKTLRPAWMIQIGLFLSPVVYPLSSIPEQWRDVYVVLNPVATAIDDLRLVMLHGEWPAWGTSALALGWSLLLRAIGFALFKRLERGFADRV